MGGGGAERVLVTLLNALDPEQYDITLLLIYKEGPFFSEIPGHVKVKWLFQSYASLSTRLLTHYYSVRNYVRKRFAHRKLGGEKFDIAVSFMEGAPAKLHSQLLNYAEKNLTWVHFNFKTALWYDFWFKRKEEHNFYNRVDRIAFFSKELRAAFESEIKSDTPKYVIYNPIDISEIEFATQGVTKNCQDDFLITNIGRLVPLKNHNLLIDVAVILKQHGRKFKIQVLGCGPMYDKLIERVRELNLEDYVYFKGFKKNPFPDVAKSDIFCMTSVSEGCPMVIAEAMALGTPIVSTPIAAVDEMLSQGGGCLTDGTADNIVRVIEDLMDNPEKRLSMGRAAKNSALMFDIHNVITMVTDFIDGN